MLIQIKRDLFKYDKFIRLIVYLNDELSFYDVKTFYLIDKFIVIQKKKLQLGALKVNQSDFTYYNVCNIHGKFWIYSEYCEEII